MYNIISALPLGGFEQQKPVYCTELDVALFPSSASASFDNLLRRASVTSGELSRKTLLLILLITSVALGGCGGEGTAGSTTQSQKTKNAKDPYSEPYTYGGVTHPCWGGLGALDKLSVRERIRNSSDIDALESIFMQECTDLYGPRPPITGDLPPR